MKKLAIVFLYGLALTSAGGNAANRQVDCSAARDPRRCEALQAAREACGGLEGLARSACVREALPPPDCKLAPNATQCQARQAAEQACADKRGKARRKCIKVQSSMYKVQG